MIGWKSYVSDRKQSAHPLSATIVAGYIRAVQGVPQQRAGIHNRERSQPADSRRQGDRRVPCCCSSRDRNPATPFLTLAHILHSSLHGGDAHGDVHGGRGLGQPIPGSRGSTQAG